MANKEIDIDLTEELETVITKDFQAIDIHQKEQHEELHIYWIDNLWHEDGIIRVFPEQVEDLKLNISTYLWNALKERGYILFKNNDLEAIIYNEQIYLGETRTFVGKLDLQDILTIMKQKKGVL